MFNIGTYMIEPNTGRCKKEYVPQISGYRRALHSDLPALERLISIKTYDTFGNIDIGQLYESSCYTVIQYNEKGDIISGIFLCNYPNIPSVPKQEWLHWLRLHYKEEDNDDIIPIIDADSSYVKELYGEYYISEMIRYPDGNRQLIVSEDDNGLTTGVICLNSNIDVDILNENFELNVYRGLRKPHETDDGVEIFQKCTSEILSKTFSGNMQDLLSDNVKLEQKSSAMVEDKIEIKTNFENELEKHHLVGSKSTNIEQKIFTIPNYYGQVNAFVVEIFAVRDDIGNRGTREFLETAFECFPDLDYCVLLLPSAYSYFSFLEQFVRVPLRCNKDFPMSLYLSHKAVLFGEIKTHKADFSDRTEVKKFLINIPKSTNIMKDFNRSINRINHNDLNSYIFKSDNTIIGLAIVCIEKDHEQLKKNFHVEDFITRRYIFNESYGRLLHFVLMPIFSTNQKFFFCEIMRLNDLTILYYRLYEEEGSSLTRTQPLVSCLNTMVPVNPRRRIEYKFCDCLSTNNMTDEISKNNNKLFSLFMTTPRIATIPNKIIDTKIVVVGGSDCGIAFVEFLALG
ncbi:cilia- and flagella-associated protein 61-like [Polistes fuscatus]|uniref:cilia- and flagella-associated protein 61-like n=1 Tax=Polistes fuscatus TaxID=30207 RepID=UPI001CA91C8E|nr:cilia- and flagella-associated protein 61-like [Polistes fuscatus]